MVASSPGGEDGESGDALDPNAFSVIPVALGWDPRDRAQAWLQLVNCLRIARRV